jgi:hypothetical protein
MIDAVPNGSASGGRGRPVKFTPERIQQICNLVERGRSRDEIAEIIGVTAGSLQVTCSKLGISLRRSRFNVGTGLLPRQSNNGSANRSRLGDQTMDFVSGTGPQPSGEATMPDAVLSGTRCPAVSSEGPKGKDGVGRKPTSDGAGPAILQEYAFQVNLVAVVRVRAANEILARKVVPSVLGSPGSTEIRLANECNNSLGLNATVTVVDFFAKGDSAVLLESNE